jgi:hypothetical protein
LGGLGCGFENAAGRKVSGLPCGDGILFPFSPALEFVRLTRAETIAAIWLALIFRGRKAVIECAGFFLYSVS